MKIDFNTVIVAEGTGYANVTEQLTRALEGQGVEISPGSDVMLNFCMPPDYVWRDVTIGYTPWESTEVPNSWIGGLRAVDDLWATSEFVKNIYAKYTKGRDIFVLPHGLDEFWKVPGQFVKNGSGKFTFLHIGEPAERKGGDIVLEAWHRAFAERDDVRLIYKCNGFPRCRIKDRWGSIIASPSMYNNVDVIDKKMTKVELLGLYYFADCLVYPSRGEGWGLIPFEAMACGLPTILHPLAVGSFGTHCQYPLVKHRWEPTPVQKIHPGEWLDYEVEEVIELMELAILDRDKGPAMDYASQMHSEFSWDKVAESVIWRLDRFT